VATLEQELERFVQLAPEISEKSDYWFVRTQGGVLLDTFVASGSIAVNYSRVSLKEIPKAEDLTYHDRLKALISKQYPKNAQPGFAANQIWTFARVMKKGDFVICPSYGTAKLALGIVADDELFEEELEANGKHFPDFRLRRRVKWVRQVERASVNPKLFSLLFTHQAIVSAKSYAAYIDPLYYDFYRKGDKVHYVMDIGHAGSISAPTLFYACTDLLSTVDEIAEGEDLTQDSSALSTKVNLNSPGVIEFAAAHPAVAVAVVAITVVFLVGGGLKLKIEKAGLDMNLGGDGLISKISQYLGARQERKLTAAMQKKLDALDVRDSDVIVKLLKERSGKGKK
jgi:restriction system protein